jgi:hypothetical protein
MRLKDSPLFEIGSVLVRFDHVANFIVNANRRKYVSGCDASRNRLRCWPRPEERTTRSCPKSSRKFFFFSVPGGYRSLDLLAKV